jgi:hypothetical protein
MSGHAYYEDFISECDDLSVADGVGPIRLSGHYHLGKPENKPEVLKQMEEIKAKRVKMMMEHQFQQQYQARFEEQHNVIQALAKENEDLKAKVATLDAQIKKSSRIKSKREN